MNGGVPIAPLIYSITYVLESVSILKLYNLIIINTFVYFLRRILKSPDTKDPLGIGPRPTSHSVERSYGCKRET